MKKSLKLFATAAIVLTGMGLASCGEDEVTLRSVAYTGVKTNQLMYTDVTWEDLVVTFNYSDDSKVEYTYADFEFDVNAVTKDTTKAVIYTEGLYALEAPYDLTGKTSYKISVALEGNLSNKYDLLTIKIGAGDLASWEQPDFVKEYNATKAAGADKNAENKFTSLDDAYVVGTLNEFIYEPVLKYKEKGSHASYSVASYPKEVKVYGSDGNPAPTGDYQVTEKGVKFNDSAIGKTYSVGVKQTIFSTDIMGDAVPELKSMEFKVEKGLNVYNAKQLGILNDYSDERLKKNFSDLAYLDENSQWVENKARPCFYNAATNSYGYCNVISEWKSFLKEKKVYTEAELTAYENVGKVFLQGNIEVTTDDIPSIFIISEAEARAQAGDAHVDFLKGRLRDQSMVYSIALDGTDKEINGNYFTLNVKKIPVGNCVGDYQGLHLYTETTTNPFPGHSTLFNFTGLVPENETLWKLGEYTKQVPYAGTTGVLKNINSIGNTGISLSVADGAVNNDVEMSVTGLIFAKNPYGKADFKNVVCSQYMIGLFASSTLGVGFNPADAASFKNNAFTKIVDCKVFDCSNSGIFSYEGASVFVGNSVFKRFGGPAIIITASEDPAYISRVVLDKNTIVENMVNGTATWFSVLGASSQIQQVTALNEFTKNFGYNFINNNKFNLISLTLDGSYLESKKTNICGGVMFETADGYYNTVAGTLTAGALGGAIQQDQPLSANAAYYEALAAGNGGTHTALISTEAANAWYFPMNANFTQFGGIQYGETQPSYSLDATTGNSQGTPFALSGNYLNLMLPVGQTTLNVNIGRPVSA